MRLTVSLDQGPTAISPRANQPVDRLLVEFREDGVERREIAVNVRDKADAHSSRASLSRSLSRS